MSHEIYIDENEKAAFAFVGSRDNIWHGLGQNLTDNAPIETWRTEAGMDWEVKKSDLLYSPIDDMPPLMFPKKRVLYRSDNLMPLSVVTDEFKIVQPGEVLEFFRDLTEEHGMKLSTAGCLFGGQRFWALAETGRKAEVTRGDEIRGHLLFVTSVDGTMSSTARFVSTRVVCNNTMAIALNEKSKHIVRKTHRTVWDNNKAKIDLGLIDQSWEVFMNNLTRLSNRKMNDNEILEFFKKTEFDPEKEEGDQGWGAVKRVNTLSALYHNGAGANLAFGTAFGALNAVTNFYTHGTGRKGADRAFWAAYVDNDKVKEEAMETLLELC